MPTSIPVISMWTCSPPMSTKRYDEANYRFSAGPGRRPPIAWGEVGGLPSPEILQAQPKWAWFMSWRDPDNFFWNDGDSLKALFDVSRAITLEELPWVDLPRAVKLHTPVLK